MTPQELKNSILQLAIQGRLVEQRPEEGTGEALYHRIQWEKQALIKAGKIRKEKPLPKITWDEIPFEIPEGWVWVRLGSIGITVTGSTPAKAHPEYYGGDFPFFKPSDLDAGRHIYQASEYLTEAGKGVSRQLTKGAILVCCIGSIGKAAIIDVDGTANQQINALIPLVSESEYLLYAINSVAFQCQLDRVSRATTLSIINKSIFNNCILPLPPLAEQKRIVAKIEELMPLIDRYEEAWTKLEEFNKRFPDDMQKSLLQLAIKGGLVPQDASEGTGEELYRQIQREKQALIKAGKIRKEKPLPEITEEEIPFEIPEGWVWVKIEQISYSVGNKSNQILASSILKKGRFPVVSQGKEFIDGFCDDKDKVVSDTPVIMFGDHTRNVKYVDFPFVIGADGTKFIKGIVVDARFLYFLVVFSTFSMWNRGYARHYSLLKKQWFPLPPLAEQKRIVAKLEELLPLCDRLKQKNSDRP